MGAEFVGSLTAFCIALNREVFIQSPRPLSIQNLILADRWLDLMMELPDNLLLRLVAANLGQLKWAACLP
jgi:hypothetical protein